METTMESLPGFQDLPRAQLRAWARDPVTQAFLGLLSRSREMRIESLIGAASPGSSHEQAVYHHGGLDVLNTLIEEITGVANG